MNDWLLIVDMQPAFGDPESPWYTPGYEACAERIDDLVAAFGTRVTFTRFLPPERPEGAWIPYYRSWPFALAPENQWLWEVDSRWQGYVAVAGSRFAKWREASPLVPKDATLVICGVATDCCVLGTALEAVDDGRHVRLVTDACAAGTDALHEAAITVMRGRTDMLDVTTTARELEVHDTK
ncbi:cysteine hydrolase family protein [Roseibium aggregatum]|uniref:Cysteine hydrolase n=1 Tax=Roseibium aggregatum TaxID=187304 RepID=A0A939EIH6_9HYPH|nr:cysteine hydrolase [Roseibium aggregatum]MBN9672219.1 cysteine hydrolase [Roseibium aggregatum]